MLSEVLVPANFISLLAQVVSALLFFWIVKKYYSALGFELSTNQGPLIALIATVGTLSFLSIIDLVYIPSALFLILWGVKLVLSGYLTARGDERLVFLAGILLGALYVASEMITVAVTTGFDTSALDQATRATILVLSMLILAAIVFAVSKIVPARKFASLAVGLRKKYAIPILAAGMICGLIASYIHLLLLDYMLLQVQAAILTMFFAAVILATLTTLYFALGKQEKIWQESNVYQMQLEFYGSYLREKEAEYLHTKILEHDQKQHIIYLLGVLKEGRSEEGIAHLERMLQDVSSEKSTRTDNLVVDSLLSYKHEQMKKNQITLQTSLTVPKHMNINSVDLCIILGNLLSNALEATTKVAVSERLIKVIMRYDGTGESLVIIIENPHANKLLPEKSGRFTSTKQGHTLSGLGLQSVQRTLEKYDGTLRFETKADKFTVTALIYGEKNVIDSSV